jgi:FkbM family methyltransferase
MLTRARKLAQLLRTPLYRKALWKGVAAGVEHESVLRRLDCKTVIDIGANRGQFALAVRQCIPQARIVAFEPLPEPARIFRSVFAGQSGIDLHEIAIGPTRGPCTMHISGREDSSSLLPITDLQAELHPGTGEVGLLQVRVERLSSTLSKGDLVSPSLLKIDVQGFELQCLEGCMELLPNFDYVYVECAFQEMYAGQAHASQLIRFLFDHGFELKEICHVFHDAGGRPVDADFLFSKGGEEQA